MWRLSDEDILVTPLPVYASAALEGDNPIPVFDSHVTFTEANHEYHVDGVRVPCSVTGLIHSFCPGFDPPAVLRSMGSESRLGKYGDLADEDIVALWAQNGAVARTRGTLMHRQIESCGKHICSHLLAIFEGAVFLGSDRSKVLAERRHH